MAMPSHAKPIDQNSRSPMKRKIIQDAWVGDSEWWSEPRERMDVIVPEEHRSVDTGLLDANGDPIKRHPAPSDRVLQERIMKSHSQMRHAGSKKARDWLGRRGYASGGAVSDERQDHRDIATAVHKGEPLTKLARGGAAKGKRANKTQINILIPSHHDQPTMPPPAGPAPMRAPAAMPPRPMPGAMPRPAAAPGMRPGMPPRIP